MKSLIQYIKESDMGETEYKIYTWLRSHPEEQHLWDNACKSWKETRQIDDDAVKTFMNGTDIRSFVDFLSDSINDVTTHSNDIDIIKKTIMSLG